MKYEEKEVIENGVVYIVRTYESGSIAKWQKTQEDLEVGYPSTVQRGRAQLTGTSVTIAIDTVDPGDTTVAMDVQGCDTPYTYMLTEDALTVEFAKPVQAWINWEVR